MNDRFPLTVRGEDAGGDKFEVDTLLDNIGPGGLYARIPRSVKRGSDLFIVVRLSPNRSVFAPSVAIHGEVLRAEPQHGGLCGVAVKLKHHRFL